MNNTTKTTVEEDPRTSASSNNDPPVLKKEPPKAPCGCREDGRILIVCIDGTANKFGDKNTNVIRLYNLIEKNLDSQHHTWYNSGIGTFARPHSRSASYYLRILSHTFEAGLALKFEKTVQMAYRWLSDNYEEGDRIFIFGFSRGAFQARVLSAMVDKVGLIFKGNQSQIPFAYELYEQSESEPQGDGFGKTEVGTGMKTSDAGRFKDAFCRNVKIHFVGVWDTVSSIGVARRDKMLPGITEGMTHVCFFRHALALDERRVKFLPEYAHGGSGLPNHRIDQRGGGNEYNEMDSSTPPLQWMAHEAMSVGLQIKELHRPLEQSDSKKIDFKESLTGLWKLFEIYPFQRLAYHSGGREITRRPHLGAGRKMQAGQKVHCSIFLGNENGSGYQPKASPPTKQAQGSPSRDHQSAEGDLFVWGGLADSLRAELGKESWLVVDVDYYRARLRYAERKDVVKRFKELIENINFEKVKPEKVNIESKRAAAQLVYNEAITVLHARDPKALVAEDKCQLLKIVMDSDLLSKPQDYDPPLELIESIRIRGRLDDLLKSGDSGSKALAEKFIAELTDNFCLLTLEDHDWHQARSIAASPGKIVIGFANDKIRQWRHVWQWVDELGSNLNPNKQVKIDFDTWDAAKRPWYSLRPRDHKEIVISVAISHDGKTVASASRDKRIRIWDPEGSRLLRAFRDPGVALSVAISHDGRRVVSGCEDGLVRVWDAATGNLVRELHGHSDRVRSVAISHDGKHIISGSNDMTIRIWEMDGGSHLEPLSPKSKAAVRCVAITDDGNRIVSGTTDGGLQVWDAKTGTIVKEWKKHTRRVLSIAISPDNKYFASGSDDCSIRIWDLEKGEQVGVPLLRHRKFVRSVAFLSSDSKSGPDPKSDPESKSDTDSKLEPESKPSPKSKLRLVSGSDDNTILIWDMEEVLRKAEKSC